MKETLQQIGHQLWHAREAVRFNKAIRKATKPKSVGSWEYTFGDVMVAFIDDTHRRIVGGEEQNDHDKIDMVTEQIITLENQVNTLKPTSTLRAIIEGLRAGEIYWRARRSFETKTILPERHKEQFEKMIQSGKLFNKAAETKKGFLNKENLY